MATHAHSINPMEVWMATGLAMTQASMQLTSTAAEAAIECWSAALSPGKASSALIAKERPASTGTAKSWYRAPYRSPFDPMFWMTPGHPVDHVGDWMALAMAFGMPGAAWGRFMPMPASQLMLPFFSQAGPVAHAANVIDFGAVYSAYRTAGGHAAAPVLRASATESSANRQLEPFNPMEAWGWLFPFASPRSR